METQLIIKPIPYSDYYIKGTDVEGYPMTSRVTICDTCFAIVSFDGDHFEKHVEWHLDGLENDGG